MRVRRTMTDNTAEDTFVARTDYTLRECCEAAKTDSLKLCALLDNRLLPHAELGKELRFDAEDIFRVAIAAELMKTGLDAEVVSRWMCGLDAVAALKKQQVWCASWDRMRITSHDREATLAEVLAVGGKYLVDLPRTWRLVQSSLRRMAKYTGEVNREG